MLAEASDQDHGETATLSVANVTYSLNGGTASNAAPAGVSLTGSTLSVDPTNAAFNSLAVGQKATIVVSYNVKDAQGATVAQTETITITGTNDVPTVTAALKADANEGDASFSKNLLEGAADLDSGETATLAVADVTYAVNGATASATAPAGVSLTGSTLSVDPTNAAFNSLAVGQKATIVVSYNVKDAQGATVAQTETITITGTNDVPTVTAALKADANEGDASFSKNLLEGAADLDSGETATLAVADVTYAVNGATASATAPAGVSLTGSTLSVDPTNAAFNSLAVGQKATIVVSYNVKDAQGATVAQTETITITGTNDVPTVTAALKADANEGDASFSKNLLEGAADLDSGETATLAVADVTYAVNGATASATAPAGVSLTGSTLSVDPTNAAFNSLAVGQKATIVVSYNVKDAQGATVAQTETITITGTNDVPTVTAALKADANEGDASFSKNLLEGAADLDSGETATLAVADVTYAVNGATASATAPAGVSLTGSTLSVDPTNAAFNSLAVGQKATIVVSYNVKDAQGATVAQTETITITGTNDVPTVTAALKADANEGDASFSKNLLEGAADLDSGETATLAVADVTYAVNGATASATAPAGVSLTGSTLSVDPTNAAFNSLAVGQKATIVVSYNVKDAQGATVAQTETITITGTNDVPTVTAALKADANEGDASFSKNLLEGAADLDSGETATLSVDGVTYSFNGATASATAPAGVSLTGSTLSVDPTNAAFNSLAVGQKATIVVSYNVKDAQGATVAQTETITITGTNDVPTVTAALKADANEGDASFSKNLLEGAADLDSGETATLAVADVTYAVNGATASATAPAGVSLTGSTLSVDPTNAAFNSLAVGQKATIVVSYNVKDAQGATVAQTETITITGTNDVPTVTAALKADANEGDASFSKNLLEGAADLDSGETATLSVDGVTYSFNGATASATAPAGVSLTGSTLSVDPTNAAFNSLAVGQKATIVVSYNVKDAQGATVAQTETITITGTNDVPTVTAALKADANEGDASFSKNLLEGAADLDSGETATLSVDGVTYSFNGATASATAPAGVSLTGSTLSVDPTNAAFNSLAVGQKATIVVSYNVKDAQGATVAQTETITITGTNDVPTVTAALKADANEGDASFSKNLLEGAADLDSGETATLSVDGVTYSFNGATASATAPAGVSLTGSTLSVDPTNAAFNSLAVGQKATIVVSYNVKDAQGATVAQTETITITGTNDVPTVTAALKADANEGDASFSKNLLEGAADLDSGETATLAVADVTYAVNGATASATAPAGVSLTGSTLSVDPTNAAFNSLAVGQKATIVVSYNVKDAQGATVAQTETITITGTNDVPTVTAALKADANEGDASFSKNLLEGAADLDSGETATLAVADVTYAVNGATASATAPAGVSLTGSTLSVDPTNAAFNSLAVGQKATIVVSYNVKDAQGATVAQTETITITGTNDIPVLSGTQAVLAAGQEDKPYIVKVEDLLKGYTDVDGDSLSVASLTANHGTVVNNLDGTYTVTPTADYNGSVTLNYSVTDSHGAVSSATQSFVLEAVNDPAIITGVASGSVTEAGSGNNGGTATVAGDLQSSDVDNPNDAFQTVATATASANHYGSYTVSPAGVWTYTLDNNNATVNALNSGSSLSDSFKVYSQDGTEKVVQITINGANDFVPVVLPSAYDGIGDPNDFDGAGPGPGTSAGTGTSKDDVLVGTIVSGGDTIDGLSGDDTIYGYAGNDKIYGSNGNDRLYGGAGDDTIEGNTQDDEVYGGSGNDTIQGNAQNDHLYGGSGSDVINGGDGTDTIYGGYGMDQLTGGADADTFVFLSTRDTNDTITDFVSGVDKIDLSAIDANTGMASSQDFSWGGQQTGGAVLAHSVTYQVVTGGLVILADTDGNVSNAEFMLTLTGVSTVNPGDFTL